MSNFDPETFLDAVHSQASVTQRPPVKEGEYPGYVKPGTLKLDFVGKDNKPVLNFQVVIDDQGARDTTGLPEPTVRHTVWLETTSDGRPDLSASPGIGRLREAFGQNKTGEQWNLRMFEGQRARWRIKHDPMQPDGTIWAKAVSVAKLG